MNLMNEKISCIAPIKSEEGGDFGAIFGGIDFTISQEEKKRIERMVSIITSNTIYTTTEEAPNFAMIKQGKITAYLAKLGKGVAIKNNHTETATIKYSDFEITFPSNLCVKTSTLQLLDIIIMTATSAKSQDVIITLSEYMERRGLKARKEAKKQVKDDLELLKQINLTFSENARLYFSVYIAQFVGIDRMGNIHFIFNPIFYNLLMQYHIMPYPLQLFTINACKNPNGYPFLRKIAEHKYMNMGKKNENIISIKTLLNVAPDIPPYEKVMTGNRNVKNRIIKPFERDMNALAETIKWRYCHKGGKSLNDEETKNFSYDMFKNLMIKIEWVKYPKKARQKKISQ